MNLDVMTKIEEVKRPAVARSRTQDISGFSRQCSATEPQQLDNHQPSQSSICTAQVVLSGCQACDWGIQYHLCTAYRGL